METFKYRAYRIDLYPYAGGYKAFIYRPGEGIGLAGAPSLAGPDGRQANTRENLLRQCRFFIDADVASTFSYAGSDDRWHAAQTEDQISYGSNGHG